jgi:hypothetical protein
MTSSNWILIFNDGTNITTQKSNSQFWNSAQSNNVQFLIIENSKGIRHVITGMDDYNIPDPQSNSKQGSFISDAEYKRTRNFMIYGDY